MSFQSRLLRHSCCRCQETNCLMLSFNLPSVRAPWLSHTTWCPKIKCPKPVNQLKEKINPPHLSPLKVFMKDGTFLGHVCLIFTLTICSALSRSTIEAVHQRQLVIPELTLHTRTHDIIREEVGQTLSSQKFPVFRKRHLPWVPREAHSGKKNKNKNKTAFTWTTRETVRYNCTCFVCAGLCVVAAGHTGVCSFSGYCRW